MAYAHDAHYRKTDGPGVPRVVVRGRCLAAEDSAAHLRLVDYSRDRAVYNCSEFVALRRGVQDGQATYRKRAGFFNPERITVLHYCLDVRDYSRSIRVKRGSWSDDHVTLTCHWLPGGPSS